MEVKEVINTYETLYSLLEKKQEILVNRRIQELATLDEKIVSLYGHIQKMVEGKELKPTQEQKEDIRTLASKIQKVESANQELISFSLSMINKIFDGVLNIVSDNAQGYTQLGRASAKDLGISSIVEEA